MKFARGKRKSLREAYRNRDTCVRARVIARYLNCYPHTREDSGGGGGHAGTMVCRAIPVTKLSVRV